jgi:hypothetical protein
VWPPLTTSASAGYSMLGAGFENHRVDVAFDVVDGDERQIASEAERLRIGDADQQRTDQAGAFGDGDGGEIVEIGAGLFESQAHHGHDGAQVLARGKLGNHAAVFSVRGDLRGDHRRRIGDSILHHGGRGFIARSFDT